MDKKHFFSNYSKKRITFFLATKNRAKFLSIALKKIQKLKSPRDELIIIDGGSTDNTNKVIQKFKNIIDVFVSESDMSESHASNKAVLLATGKYIKLLTDDDEFYKDAIDNAYLVMEKNPDVDVLLCGGLKIRGKDQAYAYVPPGANYGQKVADVFKYGGCGLGFLIRRSAFAKTGLFTPNCVSLDNDYLAKAINSGANVKFCRINMYTHFIEDHSALINRRKKLEIDIKRIKKLYKVKDKPIINKLREKYSPKLFPLLPKPLQMLYKQSMGATKISLRKNPIWDGGFS